jgi:hypothetical protein
MTRSPSTAESGATGASPTPAGSPPSLTDMFLAIGTPDDVLTLSDVPFHGGLLHSHPAVLAIKEMVRVRQVDAQALSDPLMHSQLVAYVHKAETPFLQLEAANHKVSGGNAPSVSGGPAVSVPADMPPVPPVG